MYNLRRKAAPLHKIGDLVAVKRTHCDQNIKLKARYFEPYKILKVKSRDMYDVPREGYHDGPQFTFMCAECMKHWTKISDLDLKKTFYRTLLEHYY